ncbi:putative C2H2 finger domain protein [Lyophyllum shimeji]|uniref:C2H2 finger domain protein n=1 Tax=Lyophyllum shimeji TaxID=47721 RepID=A0A9P3UU50_LYOSH|nr:putative C2H2 finger domain protein [Lyophyllum shimeji]
MGGDHKCPVCQATFTRPQHVARHMRSHTGDRPYKCQYCGDQFARSDLLSRHVNKCHASEKPLPSAGSRRKGSASRATTSKQVCDQCVQSSLPCDGCNPCAKCVQRKCRCTFVKFHRQTAPTGPGHHPQSSLSGSSAVSTASSSSHLPIYPTSQRPSAPGAATTNDFMLGHAPGGHHHPPPLSMADNLYPENFSFAPLYANSSPMLAMGEAGDYATRYRAQAEVVRRASEGGHRQQEPHSFQDHRAAWVGWDQGTYPEGGLNEKDLHQFMASPSNTHLPGVGYPLSGSFLNDRRPSFDFSSSEGSSSMPSSASSSSVHLPLDGIPIHQTFPSSQSFEDRAFVPSMPHPSHLHHPHPHPHHQTPADPTDPANASHRSSSSSSYTSEGGGGFSSAFGLMSLDDPAVIAGLATDAAPFFSQAGIDMDSAADPNATPMPMPMPPPPNPAPQRQGQGQGQAKDLDTTSARELKEFWKEYMRTPPSSSGAGAGAGVYPGSNANAGSNGAPGTPGYRRARVASLPSAKTPTAATERFAYDAQSSQQFASGGPGGGGYAPQGQGQGGLGLGLSPLKKHPSTTALVQHGQPGQHPNGNYPRPPQQQQQRTMHGTPEDLRSYEAAVLARKAPVTLNLKPPKERRRAGGGGGGGGGGSASTSASPQIPFGGLAPAAGEGSGARVSFAPLPAPATTAHHQVQNQSGSAGSASPSIPSRESSVAVSDGSGSGSGSGSGESEGMRPSFKRMPSTTLVPANTKRALIMRGAEDGGGAEGVGVGGGGGGGGDVSVGGAGGAGPTRKDERPVARTTALKALKISHVYILEADRLVPLSLSFFSSSTLA